MGYERHNRIVEAQVHVVFACTEITNGATVFLRYFDSMGHTQKGDWQFIGGPGFRPSVAMNRIDPGFSVEYSVDNSSGAGARYPPYSL